MFCEESFGKNHALYVYLISLLKACQISKVYARSRNKTDEPCTSSPLTPRNQNQLTASSRFNVLWEVSVRFMIEQIPGRQIIDTKCNALLLSYPTEPEAKPSNVRASPDSTTSIKVEWDRVPECHRNGKITNYIVEVYNSTRDEVTHANVSGSTLVEVIEGLQGYTNYSVLVYATTAVGEGPPSELISTTTHRPGSYKGNKTFIA